VSPIAMDLSFPHRWEAEVLAARPMILPTRHFFYPRDAEEVERGALEVLVRPDAAPAQRPPDAQSSPCAQQSRGAEPFLATCALGFRDPTVPTGLWSSPKPEELCAVSGGYAYLIDTIAPERFTMIPYRPVLAVRAVPDHGLLLFAGHHSILAWGAAGQAWESGKLSDEGVTIALVEGGVLHGMGWEMLTDKETMFALDVRTGLPVDR
jgi:hypothetical protein